jgi:hypothetical protein
MISGSDEKVAIQAKPEQGTKIEQPPASKPVPEKTAAASAPTLPIPQEQGFPAAPPAPGGGGVAQQPAEPPGHRIGQILEPALWMVGALLAAAAIVMLVQAWRKRSVAIHDTLQEQLTQFRDAYQKGQMSKEEYHRVHALLTARIREKMKTVAPAPAKPGQEPNPAPDNGDAASQEKPAQDNGEA